MGLFRNRSIGYSIIVHATLGLVLGLFGAKALKRISPNSEVTLLLQRPTLNVKRPHHATTDDLSRAQVNGAQVSDSQDSAQLKKNRSRSHPLDLRPDFAKSLDGRTHLTERNDDLNSNTTSGTGDNQDAQDLLHVDGKSLQAFDQLALMINGHLDYPVMLAENGIHGMATIDLYFDHNAQIDESRSRILGDNRWIRGLFVQAARVGLSDWLRGMGSTLKKDQFRDQHFRADFVITYTSTRSSELEKSGEGSYHLVRRNLVQTCLNPVAGGVDLACAAMRIAGAISSKLSSNYKIKFEALKDRLEQFDNSGLSGLNQSIDRSA